MKPSRNLTDARVIAFLISLLLVGNGFGQTLDTILNPEKVFENTAAPTTERVLSAEPESTDDSRKSVELPRSESRMILIPANAQKQAELLKEKLRANVLPVYLDWYQKNMASAGSEKVEPKHLDPRLLKLRRAPNRGNDKVFSVVFDEQFHRHVRTRGLQLKLIENGRFIQTLIAAASVFAGLLVLYGILKIINARARAREDYLSSSQISMV